MSPDTLGLSHYAITISPKNERFLYMNRLIFAILSENDCSPPDPGRVRLCRPDNGEICSPVRCAAHRNFFEIQVLCDVRCTVTPSQPMRTRAANASGPDRKCRQHCGGSFGLCVSHIGDVCKIITLGINNNKRSNACAVFRTYCSV